MDKAGQVWEAWQELVIGRADPIVVMTTSMLAIAAVPVALTWLSMRRHKKREGKKEDEEAKPEAKPSHHGNLTKEELKEYTGKDSSKPLLVAINGKIYDVTSVSQTLSLSRARSSATAVADVPPLLRLFATIAPTPHPKPPSQKKGSDFYGPEGPYNLFTGIDASRALAKMSFKPEDLAGGTDDLSQSEKDILFDWEQKFKMKYKYVGDVVP